MRSLLLLFLGVPGRATGVSCVLRPDELAFVRVASRSTTN
jgi:hypothetical protein